jgi:hypothetical protein
MRVGASVTRRVATGVLRAGEAEAGGVEVCMVWAHK